MNEIKFYLQKINNNLLCLPEHKRKRIIEDLEAHFQAALESGETTRQAIQKMGTPEEVAAEFIAQEGLNYASFWRRLVAFIIDVKITAVTVLLVAAPAIILGFLLPPQSQALTALSISMIILIILLLVSAIGVALVYFPLFEGRFGRTPGKYFLRLRVLRENGLPIGYQEAILRRLGDYFKLTVFDSLVIFWSPKRQKAMDIVARTVVIYEKKD